MQTHIYPDSRALIEQLAREFYDYSVKGETVHIALSGGNTPKQLFQTLATSAWRERIQWQHLHFWWGDERCVAPEHQDSNYGEAQRLLFEHINIPASNIHRIHGEADAQNEQKRYATEIQKHIQNHAFDWIILGIGTDGHTASLFPQHTDYHADALTVIAHHPDNGQTRISLSAPLLERGKRLTYLVTGAGKAAILRDIQTTVADTLPYPAARIRAKNGTTEWYLDSEAAALLTTS
ncbi:MAG: 6-phosphogluconolactonase [Cardiobacteriaceae bacterium]|nr:6-phosphogluconolactonase [Cardiobacteriaceae bacterium]